METTQEAVHRLTYLANLPTFDEWVSAPTSTGQRLGQHLYNTAPDHIRRFVSGQAELDPFYVDSMDRMYIINNFLLFAYVAWDILGEDNLQTAMDMVMAEPGARR